MKVSGLQNRAGVVVNLFFPLMIVGQLLKLVQGVAGVVRVPRGVHVVVQLLLSKHEEGYQHKELVDILSIFNRVDVEVQLLHSSHVEG